MENGGVLLKMKDKVITFQNFDTEAYNVPSRAVREKRKRPCREIDYL